MSSDPVADILAHYPRIYFACHTRHVHDAEARRTLSSHQAAILDHLDELEATSLKELAEHMGVTPGTMSIAVERLVTQGYVDRERDPVDARRVQLRLTRAGVRTKQGGPVVAPKRIKQMLGNLDQDELERAVEGLALLARAAQSAMVAQARANKGRAGLADRRRP